MAQRHPWLILPANLAHLQPRALVVMTDGGLSFGAATEGYEEDPQAKLCNQVCVEAGS